MPRVFRNVYELMNWAAEQFDLDPPQRKELYEWLDSQNILKKSKDPGKEAVKYAKQLKKKAGRTKKLRTATGTVERAPLKTTRKKSPDDIDDLQDDLSGEIVDEGVEGTPWYEDDVDREDYPDLYDSDY